MSKIPRKCLIPVHLDFPLDVSFAIIVDNYSHKRWDGSKQLSTLMIVDGVEMPEELIEMDEKVKAEIEKTLKDCAVSFAVKLQNELNTRVKPLIEKPQAEAV